MGDALASAPGFTNSFFEVRCSRYLGHGVGSLGWGGVYTN